jgi:hypothetical protein
MGGAPELGAAPTPPPKVTAVMTAQHAVTNPIPSRPNRTRGSAWPRCSASIVTAANPIGSMGRYIISAKAVERS